MSLTRQVVTVWLPCPNSMLDKCVSVDNEYHIRMIVVFYLLYV